MDNRYNNPFTGVIKNPDPTAGSSSSLIDLKSTTSKKLYSRWKQFVQYCIHSSVGWGIIVFLFVSVFLYITNPTFVRKNRDWKDSYIYQQSPDMTYIFFISTLCGLLVIIGPKIKTL